MGLMATGGEDGRVLSRLMRVAKLFRIGFALGNHVSSLRRLRVIAFMDLRCWFGRNLKFHQVTFHLPHSRLFPHIRRLLSNSLDLGQSDLIVGHIGRIYRRSHFFP